MAKHLGGKDFLSVRTDKSMRGHVYVVMLACLIDPLQLSSLYHIEGR